MKGKHFFYFWSQTERIRRKYLWLQEEQSLSISATVYACVCVCVCTVGVLLLRAENQREEKTIQAILSVPSLGGLQRPASPRRYAASSQYFLPSFGSSFPVFLLFRLRSLLHCHLRIPSFPRAASLWRKRTAKKLSRLTQGFRSV